MQLSGPLSVTLQWAPLPGFVGEVWAAEIPFEASLPFRERPEASPYGYRASDEEKRALVAALPDEALRGHPRARVTALHEAMRPSDALNLVDARLNRALREQTLIEETVMWHVLRPRVTATYAPGEGPGAPVVPSGHQYSWRVERETFEREELAGRVTELMREPAWALRVWTGESIARSTPSMESEFEDVEGWCKRRWAPMVKRQGPPGSLEELRPLLTTLAVNYPLSRPLEKALREAVASGRWPITAESR